LLGVIDMAVVLMMTTFLARKYVFMLCYYAISIQRNSYAEHCLKMKRLVDFSKEGG